MTNMYLLYSPTRNIIALALPYVIFNAYEQRNANNPSYLATRERMYEGLRKAGMPEE
jgi:hypothetical protein